MDSRQKFSLFIARCLLDDKIMIALGVFLIVLVIYGHS